MNVQFRKSLKFSLIIAVITFVLAAIFSIVSSSVLSKVVWLLGILIVLLIVLIGVVFDVFGIASTSAREKPLHAMAAEKVPGAREAVVLLRNADKFASFCNDVIGDISGIVSGTATAFVVVQITNLMGEKVGSLLEITLSVIFTSLVAAITVGGKALGKYVAINSSNSIILFVGKVIFVIEAKLKIKILPREEK